MRISDWSSDVCSSDLIGALQARVAKGGGFGVRRIARKPTARVGVGEELRQMLVEFGIHRDDRGDRRFQDLLAIRGPRQRRELCLRRIGHEPYDPSRQAVSARWAEYH